MARSLLIKDQGKYDVATRWAFTNISDVPFMSRWNSQPIRVEAGETIEVSDSTPIFGLGNGDAIGRKMTIELCDQILSTRAHKELEKAMRKNPALVRRTFQSEADIQFKSPTARKVLEDQILVRLPDEMTAEQMVGMRQMQADQIRQDMMKERSATPAGINANMIVDATGVKEAEGSNPLKTIKAPAATKKITKAKTETAFEASKS